MGKFCIYTQILHGNTLFLGKFTHLDIFLHDRRSWRSRQISSLEDIINIKLIDCWGRRRARGPPVPHHFPEICSGFLLFWKWHDCYWYKSRLLPLLQTKLMIIIAGNHPHHWVWLHTELLAIADLGRKVNHTEKNNRKAQFLIFFRRFRLAAVAWW